MQDSRLRQAVSHIEEAMEMDHEPTAHWLLWAAAQTLDEVLGEF